MEKETESAIELIRKQAVDPLMKECIVFYIYLSTLKKLQELAKTGQFVPIDALKSSISIDINVIVNIQKPTKDAIVYDNKYCISAFGSVKQLLAFETPLLDKNIPLCKGNIDDIIKELQLENGDNLEVKDRLRGSLYGKFAGDALGSIYEFHRPNAIREKVTKTLISGGGYITDDSEMGISLAFALIDSTKDKLLPQKTAKWYKVWIYSIPEDVGMTTRQALSPCGEPEYDGNDLKLYNRMKEISATANSGSESNGSLMRISLAGAWGFNKTDQCLVDAVVTDISATHSRKIVFDACISYTLAIRELINTGDIEKALKVVEQMKMPWFQQYVRPGSTLLSTADKGHIGWCKCAWYYSFTYLKMKKSLKDTILDAVLEKGDCDTDASIAGALIGAQVGYLKRDKECCDVSVFRCKLNKRPFYYHGAVVFDFLNYMIYNSITTE